MAIVSVVSLRSRILPLMMAALQVGCEASFTETITSGTSTDEYVEEPLSDRAHNYEKELSVSNAAMRYLSEKLYYEFYSLGDENLHQSITLNEIQLLFGRIENDLGEITEYKEKQWAFTIKNEGAVKTVYSTKIVLQGDTRAYYHFQFVPNGESRRISAFWIDPMRPNDRTHISIDRIVQ